MPIESITPTPATPPADMISSQSAGLGQADFLKMLTQQLKSQDPLNPMDGQDFASQLATFSSLQELQNIGSTLSQSLDANMLMAHSFNNTMAASLIGRTVQAEANSVTVGSSGGSTLTYSLESAATDITVEIHDVDGKVIRTINVTPQEAGEHGIDWDGLDGTGRHVSAGTYTFTVTAKDPDGNSVPATTLIEGQVEEVRYQNGDVLLIVDGHQILLSQVLSLSDPELSRRG